MRRNDGLGGIFDCEEASAMLEVSILTSAKGQNDIEENIFNLGEYPLRLVEKIRKPVDWNSDEKQNTFVIRQMEKRNDDSRKWDFGKEKQN